MLIRIGIATLLFAIAIQITGCAHAVARTVKVVPGQSGQVAIPRSDDMESRAKAEAMMRQNCSGKNFKVVSEGETVVGKQTSTHGGVQKGVYNIGLTTQSNSIEQNVTEWTIQYECMK